MASTDLPISANPGFSRADESTAGTLRFAEVYDSSFRHVYRFIRAQVRDAATAEEIVGRVFLKVYQHRGGLPEGEEALFWILRTARTTLIDYFRVEGRKEAASIPIEELASPPQSTADPETLYAAKQRKALLIRLINEFDMDVRDVLVLKFFARRTNREIAATLEISEGAVSMRLLRALRSLRAGLVEAGW